MKLKNKKTGAIVDVLANPVFTEYNRDGSVKNVATFNSLAELNEEWEDYKEQKEYWYIDTTEGTVVEHTQEMFELTDKERKEIDNYFDTREEAEKAVKKLKAWKRLKDAGVTFKPKVIGRKWYLEAKAEPERRTFSESSDLFKDVMLIFGDEE